MSEKVNAKQNWSLIFQDMLVLMLIVCCVGVVCKLGMAAFERDSPGEDLISIVNKNKLNEEGVNEDFLAEIARGREQNPDFINSIDGNGITPLMWICYGNFNDADKDADKDLERYNYVEYMLQQPEMDFKASDATGMTSVHWAAWSGLTHCAALLIEKGGDIQQGDAKGYTPLMLAALRGNVEMVQMLLSLGADTQAINAAGLTALDLAKKHEESYQARSHWAFKLIYSPSRDEGHHQCVKILSDTHEVPAREIAYYMDSIRAEQAEYAAKLQQGASATSSDAKDEASENGLERYYPLWKLLVVILIMYSIPLVIYLRGRKQQA